MEGTLAKQVMSSPETITSMAGSSFFFFFFLSFFFLPLFSSHPPSVGMDLPLKMSVEYVSFSAHSDCAQTGEFIDLLLPPHIVLVHGDANEMTRLKNWVCSDFIASSDRFDPEIMRMN